MRADYIPGPIAFEVTDYTAHIKWNEPKDPNGMIILYEVSYKRLGDTEVCVNSWHLHTNTRNGKKLYKVALHVCS